MVELERKGGGGGKEAFQRYSHTIPKYRCVYCIHARPPAVAHPCHAARV
jgi:hypothetical protein